MDTITYVIHLSITNLYQTILLMKKIVSIITVAIVTASALAPSVFAASLPINISDVNSMITKDRAKKRYYGMYTACQKSVEQPNGDLDIIKASGKVFTDTIYDVNNKWLLSNVPTIAQKKELSQIDVVVAAELNDPKTPSWKACDILMQSLSVSTNLVIANFPQVSKSVFSEFKATTPTTIRPNLEYFESKTLGGKVAVFTDKKTNGFISVLPQFKAVIVKKTNISGTVLGYYVFIPQNEVNTKKLTLDGFKPTSMSVDIVAKMYMKIAPDVVDGPHKIAPLNKIGNLYYMYGIFK